MRSPGPNHLRLKALQVTACMRLRGRWFGLLYSVDGFLEQEKSIGIKDLSRVQQVVKSNTAFDGFVLVSLLDELFGQRVTLEKI